MSDQTKKLSIEVLIGLGVLILLGILLNPYWMPMGFVVLLTALLVLLVFGLIALVWREQPRDEREAIEIAHTGRAAYLLGSVIATIGVVVQTLTHSLDIWLVATLASMVIIKIFITASKR